MTRQKHINKFWAPTQSRDNPANLFMFVCFSFPDNLYGSTSPICTAIILRKYCRPALSGGMDWWRMEWPFSRVRKIFFRGRNFAGKSLKFRRKSDFCQISGSEILKFRAWKIAIPYPQPFHTPTRLPPILGFGVTRKFLKDFWPGLSAERCWGLRQISSLPGILMEDFFCALLPT